jgi:hypothetical protein
VHLGYPPEDLYCVTQSASIGSLRQGFRAAVHTFTEVTQEGVPRGTVEVTQAGVPEGGEDATIP